MSLAIFFPFYKDSNQQIRPIFGAFPPTLIIYMLLLQIQCKTEFCLYKISKIQQRVSIFWQCPLFNEILPVHIALLLMRPLIFGGSKPGWSTNAMHKQNSYHHSACKYNKNDQAFQNFNLSLASGITHCVWWSGAISRRLLLRQY